MFNKNPKNIADIENLISPDENFLNNEGENNLNDEMKLSVINNLLDMENNKKVNSRINKRQVNLLTQAYLYSDIYDNKLMGKLADNILLLQVSIGGLGRKELVRILQSVGDPVPLEENEKKKFRDVFRW